MKRTMLVVLATLAAVPLAAQNARPGLAEATPPPLRTGFFFQAGLGGGEERLDADFNAAGYSDPIWALTFNARAGFTLGQHARLGADFHSWIHPNGSVTETVSTIMPNLQLYPFRNLGLYVRGGGGYAWSSVSDNNYYYSSITYGGFGTNLGAGWEIPVSRTVAITPTFDWYQSWFDNGVVNGIVTDYTERVLAFGLGVTFQTH